MNKIVLIGRLARDPEVATTKSDLKVTTFTLAVDNPVNKDGERTASFIPCIAWKSTGEVIAKYMKKGSLLAVEGRLNQRSYTNKDGKIVYVTEVICNSVQFCEKKVESKTEGSKAIEGIETITDDLPF